MKNFRDFQKSFRTFLWKFECLSRVIFHNFSERLLLKIPRQKTTTCSKCTCTCSNVTTKNDSRTALVNVILAFHPNLLKSVTETIVKKASSRLYKWRLLLLSGCDGVCDSKDSDFYCQWQWWSLPSYCGSLFLAKPRAPIKSGSDVVYDGACFYLRTVAVCF